MHHPDLRYIDRERNQILHRHPFCIFYLQRADRYEQDFHSHEGMEIHVTHQATGTYIIGEQIYDICNTDIFVLNGMEMHKFISDPAIPYIRTIINFRPDWAAQSCAALGLPLMELFDPADRPGRHRALLGETDYDAVLVLLRRLQHEFAGERIGREGALRLHLLELLLILWRGRQGASRPQAVQRQTEPHAHVERILQYVSGHLRQPMTLYQIADQLHLNRQYAGRIFKQVTGSTFNEYVLSRRIHEASRLLIQTNRSVTEICLDCGLSSLSYFSRAFRGQMGVPPEKYRALHRQPE